MEGFCGCFWFWGKVNKVLNLVLDDGLWVFGWFVGVSVCCCGWSFGYYFFWVKNVGIKNVWEFGDWC